MFQIIFRFTFFSFTGVICINLDPRCLRTLQHTPHLLRDVRQGYDSIKQTVVSIYMYLLINIYC